MNEEKSVVTKNGKTITMEKSLLRWIALIIAVVTLYGFVISPVVWSTNIERDIKVVCEKIDEIEIWKEGVEIGKRQDDRTLAEIVINLKTLMRHQGLTYETKE